MWPVVHAQEHVTQMLHGPEQEPPVEEIHHVQERQVKLSVAQVRHFIKPCTLLCPSISSFS